MMKNFRAILFLSLSLLGCGYEPLINQKFINVNAISFEERFSLRYAHKRKSLFVRDGW